MQATLFVLSLSHHGMIIFHPEHEYMLVLIL